MSKSDPGNAGKDPKRGLGALIQERLEALGVNLDELEAQLGAAVKVVCVAPTLGRSVQELGESPREHVVMVRVDEDTLRKLDAWVETGAVKSRSEAAALFIREGLQVRRDELAEFEEALQQVERAKRKLREKAKSVLGKAEDNRKVES